MRPNKFMNAVGAAAISLLLSLTAHAEDETRRADFDTARINSFSGALLAGRTAEADRDRATAIAMYEKALEFENDNSDIKRRLMIMLFASGRFDEGVEIASELKGDPAIESTARLALGIDSIRQREYSNAQNLLSYEGVNDLEKLLYGLLKSWAYFGDDKGEEAQAMIDSLEGPDWYTIFKNFHSAALQEALGNTEKAKQLYTAVIADQNNAGTAPDTYIRSVMALAGLEAREGNTQKAYDAVATGTAFTPGYTPLKALRERIDAGDPPKADIRTSEQGAAAVLYTIGSALNRSGAEDLVSLYLNFAVALDPQNDSVLIILAGLAENLGNPEQAIDIYRKVPEDSVVRRVSELQLGLNLADLGQLEEAKTHLSNLIEEDPSDMRSYLAYGSVLSDAKAYREMANNYDRAVKVIGLLPDRSEWNIFYQRGIAYERLGEWEKAEPNFKRALELVPNQPQVMNYLGYSWIDMNINLEEGLELIRNAVRARPNDGYIVDSLGWAYYRLGNFEDAVKELERAVEIRPADPTINDHLGDAYWRAGRELEARFQWERTLTMEPAAEEIPAIKRKIAEGLPALADTVLSPANDEIAPDETKVAKKPTQSEPNSGMELVEEVALTDYVVKPGQSLWKIADEILGGGNLYQSILQLNPSLKSNPDLIHPGQIIKLP